LKKLEKLKKNNNYLYIKKNRNLLMIFDIIIIGAGPAGLSLACALSNTKLRIAIIEKQPKNYFSNPIYDGREIALTHNSIEILKKIGIWSKIPSKDIFKIKEARVMDGNSSYFLHFDHKKTCKNYLGCLISNQLIRQALYKKISNLTNIKLIPEIEVISIENSSNISNVHLSNKKKIQSKLIVAADGRLSKTREKKGISSNVKDFGTTMIVCKMKHTKSNNNIAYEYFHYFQTMAILPLKRNISSIITTLPNNMSKKLLNLEGKKFNYDIEQRLNSFLGKMDLVSKRYAYPMLAVHANKFFKERFVLVGDSAVGMHPVTAHGFNLGLKGIKILSEEIKSAIRNKIDIASSQVLKSYEVKLINITMPLYLATNSIVKLYTNQDLPSKIARKAILRLGNIMWPLKNAIMDKLLIKSS